MGRRREKAGEGGMLYIVGHVQKNTHANYIPTGFHTSENDLLVREYFCRKVFEICSWFNILMEKNHDLDHFFKMLYMLMMISAH